jgi:chitinase
MSAETFLAYWMCNVQAGPLPQEAPASVDVVALAFAVTAPVDGQDSLTLDYLAKYHSLDDIKAGAKALQARGTKVTMSINGNPNWPGHPGGWTNLNAPVFAQNVAQIVLGDWGLDGVDLDNEAAETPDDNFVAVVQALRQVLGPNALLTLPVYEGPVRDAYLSQVVDQISYVSTMAYWLDYQGQIDLYQQYAALVGDPKVAIGVAQENSPFSEVGPLAAWDPPGSNKAGMMYWNLNSPPPSQTALWCATIAANLPKTP